MGIEYVIEHIREDINRTRNNIGKNISPEIGKVLYSFVTYYQNNNMSDETFFKFRDVIVGLEKNLRERTKQPIYLHETRKSGAEICGMLKRKDKSGLSALMKYITRLKNKDLLLNGMDQIFPFP